MPKYLDADADGMRKMAENLGLSALWLNEMADQFEKANRSEMILATILARYDLGEIIITAEEYNAVVENFGALHFTQNPEAHTIGVELMKAPREYNPLNN